MQFPLLMQKSAGYSGGSGKLKCVFYRLMWKLILMNRFAVIRLEGVFVTNVAGVVSE